jgi:hypothetical protein
VISPRATRPLQRHHYIVGFPFASRVEAGSDVGNSALHTSEEDALATLDTYISWAATLTEPRIMNATEWRLQSADIGVGAMPMVGQYYVYLLDGIGESEVRKVVAGGYMSYEETVTWLPFMNQALISNLTPPRPPHQNRFDFELGSSLEIVDLFEDTEECLSADFSSFCCFAPVSSRIVRAARAL